MRKSGKAQVTSASSIPRTTADDNCASHPQVELSKSRHYDKKCEITAHNERGLKTISYICNVAEGLRQT